MSDLENLNTYIRKVADSDVGIRRKIVNLRQFIDKLIEKEQQK